jgi:hypothetical protein
MLVVPLDEPADRAFVGILLDSETSYGVDLSSKIVVRIQADVRSLISMPEEIEEVVRVARACAALRGL